MLTKRCNVCKELLPLENFTKYKSSPDGKKYTCIECGKIKCKEYHKNHKDKRIPKTNRTNRRDSERINEDGVRVKECKDCLETFPTEGSFRRNGTLKDGRPRFQTRCIICEDIYSKKWQIENRERRQEYHKYRRDNGIFGPKVDERKKRAAKAREEKEQRLKWEQENPELALKEKRAKHRESRQRQKERDPAYFRQQQVRGRQRFLEKHGPEYHRQALREWKKNNYGTWMNGVRKRDAIRRARRAGTSLDTHHTEDQWQELLKICGHRCVCCGRHQSEAPLTRDHVIPLSKGGLDAITNIQPLCRNCNSMKMTSDDRFIPPYEELMREAS